MSRARFALLAAILAAPLLYARMAYGQESLSLTGYGVRAGASLDDELVQLLVGGHVDLGRPWQNVRVQPLATLGLGDDALTLLIAGEAHYLFAVDPSQSRVDPYAGGGVGVHHVNFDEDDEDDDSTEVVLLLTAGVDIPMRQWWKYFAETRFLIGDNAVFRLEGGVTWTY